MLRVVLSLSRASAQLATSLEPREHGEASPISQICEAIEHLHTSAAALAALFAADLARAHRVCLEALLGVPLLVSLVERVRIVGKRTLSSAERGCRAAHRLAKYRQIVSRCQGGCRVRWIA